MAWKAERVPVGKASATELSSVCLLLFVMRPSCHNNPPTCAIFRIPRHLKPVVTVCTSLPTQMRVESHEEVFVIVTHCVFCEVGTCVVDVIL